MLANLTKMLGAQCHSYLMHSAKQSTVAVFADGDQLLKQLKLQELSL